MRPQSSARPGPIARALTQARARRPAQARPGPRQGPRRPGDRHPGQDSGTRVIPGPAHGRRRPGGTATCPPAQLGKGDERGRASERVGQGSPTYPIPRGRVVRGAAAAQSRTRWRRRRAGTRGAQKMERKNGALEPSASAEAKTERECAPERSVCCTRARCSHSVPLRTAAAGAHRGSMNYFRVLNLFSLSLSLSLYIYIYIYI